MSIDYKVVIPARYGSSRLPGKPLLEVAGRPLLQHVYDNAMGIGVEVIVATDDQRIADAARSFGAEVCMTSDSHVSGSDRVAEVAETYGWSEDTIVVNVQGDEPLMPVAAVQQVAENLARFTQAGIATLSAPLDAAEEVADPNVVKVIADREGYALYFSRAQIPWDRETAGAHKTMARRHIGLYAYRVSTLQQVTREPVCALELAECLEQLRPMWMGLRIHVADACELPGPGVDTAADLELVNALLAAHR